MVIYPNPLKTQYRAFKSVGFLQKPPKIQFFCGWWCFFRVSKANEPRTKETKLNRAYAAYTPRTKRMRLLNRKTLKEKELK